MGRSSNDYDDMTSYKQFQKIETRYGSQLVELGKTVRNTSLSASDRIQAANKLLDLYNRFVADSRNSDFVWIKQYEVMLDDLIKNREQLDARAHFLNDVLPNLPDQVMQLIKEQPGITQTELYQRFDSRLKKHISEFLYFAAKSGSISRVKDKNTYRLLPAESPTVNS